MGILAEKGYTIAKVFNPYWTARSVSGTALETRKKGKTPNGLFLEGLHITIAVYKSLSVIHRGVALPTTSSQED